MRRIVFALAASCFLLPAPFAAAGTGSPPARPAATTYQDVGTVIESSSAHMALTNFGAFAYDLSGASNWGLRFPEEYGPGVIFASGLWLGANVLGQTRVAIAAYDQEYRPGSALGGTPESPDLAYLHVFKLYRTYAQPSYRDLALEDYDNNALSRGAPLVHVLGDGSLDIPGDEMAWAVYNDLAPAGHVDAAGSTAPLGVEVQQTTWSYLRGGPWAGAFLLRFTLLNRGPNTLGDMHVGFWADPDLGGFADDLVASDSTLNLAYCYNATNSDALYDATPPAVGYCLLQGPAGSPATACIAYTNGTDPVSASESFNSMHGLTRAGGVIHDPGGHTTRFMYGGDPVAGTGWIDPAGADKRMLLSAGPFTMAPNAEQQVVLAIVVSRGTDRLDSVNRLKSDVSVIRTAFATNQMGQLGVPGPAGAQLAIERTWPNPARGGFNVSFRLAGTSPATLEVIDVSGRRVFSRHFGVFAMETRNVAVEHAGDGFPAGVYFVRLTQGGRSVQARAVLLR